MYSNTMNAPINVGDIFTGVVLYSTKTDESFVLPYGSIINVDNTDNTGKVTLLTACIAHSSTDTVLTTFTKDEVPVGKYKYLSASMFHEGSTSAPQLNWYGLFQRVE